MAKNTSVSCRLSITIFIVAIFAVPTLSSRPTFVKRSLVVCDYGFYDNAGTCTPCSAPCESCTTSDTTCDGCAPGKYLDGTTCTACVSPCVSCSSAVDCNSCTQGLVLLNSRCNKPTSTSDENKKSGLSLIWIIVISVGSALIAIIILVVLIRWCCFRKKKINSLDEQNAQSQAYQDHLNIFRQLFEAKDNPFFTAEISNTAQATSGPTAVRKEDPAVNLPGNASDPKGKSSKNEKQNDGNPIAALLSLTNPNAPPKNAPPPFMAAFSQLAKNTAPANPMPPGMSSTGLKDTVQPPKAPSKPPQPSALPKSKK